MICRNKRMYWRMKTSILLQGEIFDDESDAGDDEDTPSSTSSVSRSELFRQVGQQISPILIPLLFGGLTFLCTLPFVLNGYAYIPFNRFWPVGLVIVALAILQGMGLYYAGSNNVYWMMGVVGGFLPVFACRLLYCYRRGF